MENPYLPKQVYIDEIITETEDKNLKTFKLVFVKKEDEANFSYLPGQFAELSIPGKGEIPIGIASSPTEKGFLKFTINKVGVVTHHMHNMKPGELLGIRGPLGNGYPWKKLAGKTVVMIGGGFGFTTLRSSITYMLNPDNRSNYREIHVVVGARTPGMHIYMDELVQLEKRDDIYIHIVAQEADEEWKYHVGLAPVIAQQTIPTGDPNTIAIVCGPPLMIKFTQPVLEELGYSHDNILTALEMRMKCGIGMCGRCNIGEFFVCKDGPVFDMATLNELPKEW